MDRKGLADKINESYVSDIKSWSESMQGTIKRKALLDKALEEGKLDPILEFSSWVGSSMWPVYVTMPLNKPLFFKTAEKLRALGWREVDRIAINKGNVSQGFRMGEWPEDITVQLNACGEGQNCRLVVLEEGVRAKAAVVEWVCEEGAEEDERILHSN